MTASLAIVFFSGSKPPAFFNNTMLSVARRSAAGNAAMPGLGRAPSVEKSQPELQAENISHRFVHFSHIDQVGLKQCLQMIEISGADHLQIDSGEERLARRIRRACCVTVGGQFANGLIIADHGAIKFPFAAENVAQKKSISGGRDCVECIESGHEGGN